MTARVGVGGLWHETNSFSTEITRRAAFEAYQLAIGDDLIVRYECTGTKLGGMIEGACHHGIDLAPTLFAAAVPSGVIDRAAHPGLVDDLVARLEQAMPLDGMSLVPHGAAVAEGIDDAGGWILARVRDVLPSTAPLIATFDCHANLSQAMVERADMLHRLEEDGAIPNGSIAMGLYESTA